MIALHRRLAALLALIALLGFVSGAGLDAPSVIPAGLVLLLAVFVQPGAGAARVLEGVWRAAAVILAVRAAVHIANPTGSDPVLPMVDLLLLLLCAESLRMRDASGDARHFALTFALLIASAAYRPGPLFGLLFVVYVVCATVVLVVGHLARQAKEHDVHMRAPPARFITRVALLSTVVLGVSAAVFLFFPRVSRGWAARATPIMSSVIVGFSDRVSIGTHGTRIQGNPEVVLRVEFPDGPPPDVQGLHWRGRGYNLFDGETWSRSERSGAAVTNHAAWPGDVVEQVVYARPLGNANVIFGLHPVMRVEPLSRIRPMRSESGDWIYAGTTDPVYRVHSRSGKPSPEALRAVATNTAPPGSEDGQRRPMSPFFTIAHLQLPPLTARIQALADSFRAVSPTRYDQARAIESWLRTEFAYTLDLPATARQATLDYFLFERRAGHCEYFSTAMAVLLRAGGVPTRNVNGFLGGEWNEFGGFLTVTQNQAHSWVEVYFPDYGWVEFDPTPAGAAGAAAGAGRRFARFGQFFEGVEHRWGKWILDYDLAKQADLVDRATGSLTREQRSDGPGTDTQRSWWPLITSAVLLAAAWLTMTRLGTWQRHARSAPTRTYLRIRNAYQRAGYTAAGEMPPLQFAAAVAAAPGGAAAREAVNLYLRARFGGNRLTERESAQLQAAADAVRAALKRS